MNKLKSTLLVSLFLFSFNTQADTLLLLHGYMGSTYEWQRSGIVNTLHDSGWRDAGSLHIVDNVVQKKKKPGPNLRRSYTLALQSENSIEDQATQLDRYVEYVRAKHPGEQIIFIGHSAGGVVARLYMVEQRQQDLIALITIASPHLGTDKAEYLKLFSLNLFAWLEPIPGLNKLYHSQGLLFDLIPNRSDNLIGWLNYQEHPQAQYISVVRDNSETEEFDLPLQDFIVPSWSQDMNEVYALRGRCETFKTRSMHNLSKKDALVLQKILVGLYTI